MKKILVVNNDIDTMSLLKSWLERKKFEIKFTSNGDEVVALAKEFDPDLLIIDVLQYKAAENIKSNESTNHLPIIIMTGYTLPDRQKFLIAADDVIEKPFDPKFLHQKIEKFLK